MDVASPMERRVDGGDLPGHVDGRGVHVHVIAAPGDPDLRRHQRNGDPRSRRSHCEIDHGQIDCYVEATLFCCRFPEHAGVTIPQHCCGIDKTGGDPYPA